VKTSYAKRPLGSFYWVLSLLIFVILPIYAASISQVPILSIEINKKVFQLEIVTSAKDRQRGLMYRSSLNNDRGMLFIYPNPGDHRIWMKNTLIPLTVIWVDQFAVVLAVKRLVPCIEVNCPVFSSRERSRFIIELNADAHNISVGDQIPDLLEIGA
jgi:uncharacterized membrane protein (UPF0127 family)